MNLELELEQQRAAAGRDRRSTTGRACRGAADEQPLALTRRTVEKTELKKRKEKRRRMCAVLHLCATVPLVRALGGRLGTSLDREATLQSQRTAMPIVIMQL